MRKMTDNAFWSRVSKDGPVISLALGPCWPWSGPCRKDGYGNVPSNRWGTRLAHRIAALLCGIISDPTKDALHKCDNRPCCNPDHLYSGTDSDNLRDAFSRDRRTNVGESNPRAKLMQTDVDMIRLAYPILSKESLARRFDVSVSLIEQILRRKVWT